MEAYKERYTEIEPIGQGAFGSVFLVKEKNTGLFFAAKQLSLINMAPEEVTVAQSELRLLKNVSHPNIVQYKENFADNAYMIIIMEYCEDGELGFHIEKFQDKNVVIPEKVVLNWFLQIVMAVHYLHENHILHRDLKTSNIFLTANGNIKIGDFGIAKMLSSTQKFTKTLIGTPYYLSPETVNGQPYSFKSDIWALGCILYELCYFKKPFDGDDLIRLMNSIAKKEPVFNNTLYSKDLIQLNRKLLQKQDRSRLDTYAILTTPFIVDCMNDFIKNEGQGFYMKNRQKKTLKIHSTLTKNKTSRTSEIKLKQLQSAYGQPLMAIKQYRPSTAKKSQKPNTNEQQLFQEKRKQKISIYQKEQKIIQKQINSYIQQKKIQTFSHQPTSQSQKKNQQQYLMSFNYTESLDSVFESEKDDECSQKEDQLRLTQVNPEETKNVISSFNLTLQDLPQMLDNHYQVEEAKLNKFQTLQPQQFF